MSIKTLEETVSVQLPRELVEKVALLMQPPDDDYDFWVLYCACLNAIKKDN